MQRLPLRAIALLGVAFGGLLLGAPRAAAWGAHGHRVIALFADRLLRQDDPAVRAKVVALLASDKDNRWTKTDIASEAVWADTLREKSPEARSATTGWHYVPLKIDNPDLARDCFGRPPLPAGYPASHGPRDNCSVDKIEQFEAELRDPKTPPGERTTALKFLLNLVGDLHQPLYTIDRGDQGGRCVALLIGSGQTPVRLSSYWDETLVAEVTGRDPARGAAQIATGLTSAEGQQWASGGPQDWARESHDLAKSIAYGFLSEKPAAKYTFPASKGEQDSCGEVDLYRVGPDYETKALALVKEQLAKAGVRLALVLRSTLK